VSDSRSPAARRGRGVPQQHRYRLLQALEDAISYRQARLTDPCADCGPSPLDARCAEHACDLALIAGYRQAAHAIAVELGEASGVLRRPG